jgi:hypothetical protein
VAIGILLIAGGFAARPGAAWAAPFERGDLFGGGSGAIDEYSPTGQLVQTIPTQVTSGGDGMCFDPSGRHLVVPGVGLYSNAGKLLPSHWASVAAAGHCVVDGFGYVYADIGGTSTYLTIDKFDLEGDMLQTFELPLQGQAPSTWDLAPDQCTIDYGDYLPLTGDGEFNICTDAGSGRSWAADDLQILPDWSVLGAQDVDVTLTSASGQGIRAYYQAPGEDDDVRTVLLDPDGTSFWSCCWSTHGGQPYDVIRWDLNTGQALWRGMVPTAAVYGPPLLGNADIEKTVDSNPSGTAEAFLTRVGYSGQMTSLHLYVDASSKATRVVVGTYADKSGHPGSLLGQAATANVMKGSWNDVDVPSVSVTAGQRYWIAVLVPSGGGTVRFREASSGLGSETSAQHKLSAMPASWSTGSVYGDGRLSAYGS